MCIQFNIRGQYEIHGFKFIYLYLFEGFSGKLSQVEVRTLGEGV